MREKSQIYERKVKVLWEKSWKIYKKQSRKFVHYWEKNTNLQEKSHNFMRNFKTDEKSHTLMTEKWQIYEKIHTIM